MLPDARAFARGVVVTLEAAAAAMRGRWRFLLGVV
jgi:hypothetical protein